MNLINAIDPQRRLYDQSRWPLAEKPLPRNVKEWERVLSNIRADFEYAEKQLVDDFESYAIKCYGNAGMFPMHKTWHWAVTWNLKRFQVVLAAARAAFPQHQWAPL